MKKKILSILLTLVMVIGMLPTVALAAPSDKLTSMTINGTPYYAEALDTAINPSTASAWTWDGGTGLTLRSYNGSDIVFQAKSADVDYAVNVYVKGNCTINGNLEANVQTTSGLDDVTRVQLHIHLAHGASLTVTGQIKGYEVLISGPSNNPAEGAKGVIDVKGGIDCWYDPHITGYTPVKIAGDVKALIGNGSNAYGIEGRSVTVESPAYVLIQGKTYALEDQSWINVNADDYTVTKSATRVEAMPKVSIKDLKEIKVTAQPTKTEYFIGDDFDPAGMVVTAYYDDDTSKVLSSDYTLKYHENMPKGIGPNYMHGVQIVYEEDGVTKDASVQVKIEKSAGELTSIAITTQPTKTMYRGGDDFDPTGMVVTAHYANGTSSPVTDYTLQNNEDMPVGGKNDIHNVLVSYEENEVTKTELVPVKVKNTWPLTGIEITKAPDKTTYAAGDNFDPTGMVVIATYEDGFTRELTSSEYDYSDGYNLTKGTTKVTISYYDSVNFIERYADQAITVGESGGEGEGEGTDPTGKTLTKIEISTQPTKTKYRVGSTFDPTGMVVTATYDDNSTAVVTDYTLTGNTNMSADEGKVDNQHSVWVSYTENGVTKTDDVLVKVTDTWPLTGIEITKAPDKTTYAAGDNFDPTGMVVIATYEDGFTRELTSSEYDYSDGYNLTKGTTKVTISYYDSVNFIERYADQAITVGESGGEGEGEGTDPTGKTLTKIEITTEPTKKNYRVGSTFDPTGMVVTATYDDNSTAVVTDYTLTGDTNMSADEGKVDNQHTVRVSYTENGVTKTDDVLVKVKDTWPLTGIEITKAPDKTTYAAGDNFDPTGMVVIATYEDGFTRELTSSEYDYSDGYNLTKGTTKVTISYYDSVNLIERYADQAITVGESGGDNPVPTKYAVTVTNGTADKAEAAEGETVTITATVPEGNQFAGWTTEDGVEFADASAAETTFTMPAKAVTVTATYEEISEPPVELEKTEAPTITYEVTADAVIITATGEGEVKLYIGDGEVGNPYTIPRGEEDVTVIAVATAQEAGKEVSERVTYEVQVPAKEVTPAPTTAYVELYKTDANGNPLEGATFTLTPETGDALVAVSNVKGTVPFENVPNGTYVLAETEAPEGYVKSEKTYTVVVNTNAETDDMIVTWYGPENDLEAPIRYEGVTVINEAEAEEEEETTSVTVVKEWEDGDGLNRPESIEVYLTANGEEVTDTRMTLDESNNWTHTWEELPVKDNDDISIDYSVGEVKVDNYTSSVGDPLETDTGIEITITNTLSVEPEPETITIKIPYEKIVKNGGNRSDTDETFTFEVKAAWNSNPDALAGLAITGNTVATTGPKTYTGFITITGTMTAFGNAEGAFLISEKNDGTANWTYDDTVWYVAPILAEPSADDDGVSDFEVVICEWKQMEGDSPTEYEPDMNRPVDKVSFTNTYTKTVSTGGGSGSSTPSKPVLNKEDHFAFLAGYTDGTFGPERNMTRGEVATMFARLLTDKMDMNATYENSFSDVPADYWAYNFIGYVQKFGLISGYSDGTFRPNAPITRAEFATIACRFEELTEGTKTFSDVPETYWAYRFISHAAERGWVSGYTDGTFKPDNYITRAEVVTVTCRLLERNADKDYINKNIDDLKTFPDVDEDYWAYWFVMEATNGHDYTKKNDKETWYSLHK